jgi:hypothetical protein
MMFLLTYLRQEIGPEMDGMMNSPTHVTHIFPLCCLKPWPIGSDMIHRCKHGILQYTVVRPLTTVISLYETTTFKKIPLFIIFNIFLIILFKDLRSGRSI